MRTQKVLIVEDDPAALRDHAAVLAGEGYRVIEASTCADALRVARAETPDLILLDASLPDGEGVGVCRKIKAHEGLGGAFVVMLSGMDTTAEPFGIARATPTGRKVRALFGRRFRGEAAFGHVGQPREWDVLWGQSHASLPRRRLAVGARSNQQCARGREKYMKSLEA